MEQKIKNFIKHYLPVVVTVVRWLEVPAHRRKLYTVAATAGAVLVAAGFLTSDQVAHVLNLVGGVLLIGNGSLAARNAV